MNTRVAIALALFLGTTFCHAAGETIGYPAELIGKYAPSRFSYSDEAKAAGKTDTWTGISISNGKATIEYDTCKPTNVEASSGGYLIAERCEGGKGEQTKRTIRYTIGGATLTADNGKTSATYTKCDDKS